ncbi:MULTISPECIES: 3'-5' exonuclease [unclassified Modicisalibacter]|uniref:3'-5' exonuclease n=1 Tax=unclassified Modicisalibacter TaxID=2679913 RepID=UPI001E0D9B66|nr:MULTISPECIES: 3'-5' exonuclease [unclassified Modicisalibacter]MBZ9557216.1 UvrD-helicase domain-containing protein [Modicisalibacter sp. R2A 31.J]MBZ9574070.1 UvrD-helicase domain-containing protein [Modicisalibacter sp. MOD 31.J]
MKFLISETFTSSLARLTGEEQKSVKTTAFDLQMNPANPRMKFHKLDKARDKHFWSVRVSRDIRLIVHKSHDSLLLCYVDHHDKAYRWAESRKLEVHPRTGAAQIVQVRETVQEIRVPEYIQPESHHSSKPKLFEGIAEDTLLSYGIPTDWLDDVRQADEDSLLDLAEHLPAEAAEALLELATGGTPEPAEQQSGTSPFDHPDSQRRFRIMTDVEELARALDAPWEKWSIFLHPEQRQWVERDYNGPARISGSAGTGKTVVALHRAVYLAKSNPNARILLATFSDSLAKMLEAKLILLIGKQPRLGERIDVYSMNALGQRLYELRHGPMRLASGEVVETLLNEAAQAQQEHAFSARFLRSEWEDIVDAWQLDSWEAYRDIRRLGRRTRLPEVQRATLWSIFDRVREGLKQRGLITHAGLFSTLATAIQKRTTPPYDFAIIDEAQDIRVPQLRFLAALGSNRLNSLFFAGDLGQRIFQQPFSWKTLGVNIQGRSRTLRINYRTSHQIRCQADLLLDPEITDVDGNSEERSGTISVFNGPIPTIQTFDSQNDETRGVANWLRHCQAEGVSASEMAVLVRSEAELERACDAVTLAELPYHKLDEHMLAAEAKVTISTMHLAKGLEFRAVAVMACDDEILPAQERIESVSDSADLEEVYNTERHLLYVACTRARDYLLVTSGDVASEFMEDLVPH